MIFNRKNFHLAFLVFVMFFACQLVFAQDSTLPDVSKLPSWAQAIVNYLPSVFGFLDKVPGIGPYLLKFVNIIAIVGAVCGGVFTTASFLWRTLTGIPQVGAWLLQFHTAADFFQSANDFLQPWLKWWSIFNVPAEQNPTNAIAAKLTSK